MYLTKIWVCMASSKGGEGASVQLWHYISIMHNTIGCWLNESVIQSPKFIANFSKKGECKKTGKTASFENCVKRNAGPLPLEQDLGKI